MLMVAAYMQEKFEAMIVYIRRILMPAPAAADDAPRRHGAQFHLNLVGPTATVATATGATATVTTTAGAASAAPVPQRQQSRGS